MSSIQNPSLAARLSTGQKALTGAQFENYTRTQSVKAVERLDAGLTIQTREGDLVTLTSSAYSELDAFMYNSKGALLTTSGKTVNIQNQREITLVSGERFSFTVDGDLNEEELRDIENIVKGIDEIISEMTEGDMDGAIVKALSMGDYDTVSMYSADISHKKIYSVRSEFTAESLKHMPEAPAAGEPRVPPVKNNHQPGIDRTHSSHKMNRFVEKMMETLANYNEKLVDKAQKPIDRLFKHHLEDHMNYSEKVPSRADALKPFHLKVDQAAPGRYVGEFAADEAGSFFITIHPGTEVDDSGKSRARAPLLSGVTVPYSAEFRDREANMALIEALASVTPKGGEPGTMIKGDLERQNLDKLLEVDTFRHTLTKAISRQDVWPLFLLGFAFIFFADVFVRRVTISYDSIEPGVTWFREKILRRRPEEQDDGRMDRLRSRKAAVVGQIDDRRAATRFEPQVDPDAPGPTLDEVVGEGAAGPAASSQPRPEASQMTPGEAERDETYTSRLMEAKKKAFKDRKND